MKIRKQISRKQIARNIAVILKHNPTKYEQLMKVENITWNFTGCDGVHVECELYSNNIVRYLITGTRSGMTITANTITNEIVRKQRNSKPFYTDWLSMYVEDIVNEYQQII